MLKVLWLHKDKIKNSISNKCFWRLQKALVYIKINLIDSNGSIYLTVDSVIEINNIIPISSNITLRKVNVEPYRFDEMYMDNRRQALSNTRSIQRKIATLKFYSIPLNKIHPFLMEMVWSVRYWLFLMI